MNRVANIWNKLPRHVSDANMSESFKWRLEKFMDEEEIW